MALDIMKVEPVSDKGNSDFLNEYRPKIYQRRRSGGIDDMLGNPRGIVIQVQTGDASQPHRRRMVDQRMSRFQTTGLLDHSERGLS